MALIDVDPRRSPDPPVVATFDHLAEEARPVLGDAEVSRIREKYRRLLERVDWDGVRRGAWANWDVIERIEASAADVRGQAAAEALEDYARQVIVMADLREE